MAGILRLANRNLPTAAITMFARSRIEDEIKFNGGARTSYRLYNLDLLDKMVCPQSGTLTNWRRLFGSNRSLVILLRGLFRQFGTWKEPLTSDLGKSWLPNLAKTKTRGNFAG